MLPSAVRPVSRVYWEVLRCVANEINPIQAACDSVVHPLWGSIKPDVGNRASVAEVLDSLPIGDWRFVDVAIGRSQCAVA